MTRAMLTVLGAGLGFMEGIAMYLIINVSFDAPFGLFTSGEWIGYPPLLFGGAGAICGAVMGCAIFSWTRGAPVFVHVVRKAARVGDLPNKT